MEDVDAVLADMDAAVDTARGRASIARDMSREDGSGELERLSHLRDELDIGPEALRSTLEVSLGRPLEGPDDRGRFQVPLTPAWRGLLHDSLPLKNHPALPTLPLHPPLLLP